MLVVICGIRKLMECVFTRRELRVLDDLLPENGSKVRRQRGSFFNKIHRSNWEDEEEDEADIGKKTRRLEEEEVEQRRQRFGHSMSLILLKKESLNYLYHWKQFGLCTL